MTAPCACFAGVIFAVCFIYLIPVSTTNMGELLLTIPSSGNSPSFNSLTFSPNGMMFACTLSRKNRPPVVVVWNMAAVFGGRGGFVREVMRSTFTIQTDIEQGIAFSHDSTKIAIAGHDGVHIISLALGEDADGVFTARRSRSDNKDLHFIARGVGATMISMAFGNDGKTFVTAPIRIDGETYVSEISVMYFINSAVVVMHSLRGHVREVVAMHFSPSPKNSEFFISCGADGQARLWNSQTGAGHGLLKSSGGGGAPGITDVRISPCGRFAATTNVNNTTTIWSLMNGMDVKTLSGHYDHVLAVAWSPDGKTLVTGSKDHTLRIWDVASGFCERTIQHHGSWVVAVQWMWRGHWRNSSVLSASFDRTVKMYTFDLPSIV